MVHDSPLCIAPARLAALAPPYSDEGPLNRALDELARRARNIIARNRFTGWMPEEIDSAAGMTLTEVIANREQYIPGPGRCTCHWAEGILRRRILHDWEQRHGGQLENAYKACHKARANLVGPKRGDPSYQGVLRGTPARDQLLAIKEDFGSWESLYLRLPGQDGGLDALLRSVESDSRFLPEAGDAAAQLRAEMERARLAASDALPLSSFVFVDDDGEEKERSLPDRTTDDFGKKLTLVYAFIDLLPSDGQVAAQNFIEMNDISDLKDCILALPPSEIDAIRRAIRDADDGDDYVEHGRIDHVEQGNASSTLHDQLIDRKGVAQ